MINQKALKAAYKEAGCRLEAHRIEIRDAIMAYLNYAGGDEAVLSNSSCRPSCAIYSLSCMNKSDRAVFVGKIADAGRKIFRERKARKDYTPKETEIVEVFLECLEKVLICDEVKL